MAADTTSPERIAIVGGGASSALLVIAFERLATGPLEIVVFEDRREPGRGIAYSTNDDAHRLNVPARSLSALPDDPDHFLRWAKRRDPSADADDFLRRSAFGDYLVETLGRVVEAPSGPITVRIEAKEVVSLSEIDERVVLTAGDGTTTWADRVILAVGAPSTADPVPISEAVKGSGRYVADPWGEPLPDEIASANRVVLLGTGLTMVDVALSISSRNPEIRMVGLSRSGLMPRIHRAGQPNPKSKFPWPIADPSLQRLTSEFLSQLAVAAQNGGDATDVVDALRPCTQEIWAALSIEDRRTFLARYRRLWETHRHRMAPAVGSEIAALRDQDRLEIRHGVIAEVSVDSERAWVSLVGEEADRLEGDLVINCCGPAAELGPANMPLVAELISAGIARRDELELGVEVSQRGALIDSDWRESERIFAIGPLRRAALWESVAVPELRDQAKALALELMPAERLLDRAS